MFRTTIKAPAKAKAGAASRTCAGAGHRLRKISSTLKMKKIAMEESGIDAQPPPQPPLSGEDYVERRRRSSRR
jgi:hypothetical protein